MLRRRKMDINEEREKREKKKRISVHYKKLLSSVGYLQNRKQKRREEGKTLLVLGYLLQWIGQQSLPNCDKAGFLI